MRVLRDDPVDEAAQRAWVERAKEVTPKRISDEARALTRRRAEEGAGSAPRAPMSDAPRGTTR